MKSIAALVGFGLAFGLLAGAFAGPMPAGMRDYAGDVDFVARYSEAACAIAQRKIADIEKAGLPRRLATGGHFNGYFLWDTAFCVLWARHVAKDFPIEESLDNFYRFAEPDGFIGRQFDAQGRPVWNPNGPTAFAPPLLAWAELEYFRACEGESWELKVESWEVKGQRSKVKGQTEVKGQRSKVKGQTEVKGQRSKVKGQTEDGGQRSEVKGQRSKVKGQTEDDNHHCLTSDLRPLTYLQLPSTNYQLPSEARLRRVYPALARHHRSLVRFRREDGLYFSDALGCGMDELPRYPHGLSDAEKMKGGVPLMVDSVMPYARAWRWNWLQGQLPHMSWNRQIGWIDLTCQVALDAYMLAEMAELVGKTGEAAAWRKEHQAIKETVNRLCWNEVIGFYCDRYGDRTIPRRHAGGFWALIARVATPERAARMVAAFRDPKAFGRPVPLPCLPADDPDYRPETGYWCGVVWPPTNYAAIRGLLAYGYRDEAEDIARRWYNACASMWVQHGTVFENQSPEQWTARRKTGDVDFCGWGALVPIALPREFGWWRGEGQEAKRSKVKGQTEDGGQRSEVKGQTEDDKFHCLTSDLEPLTLSLITNSSQLPTTNYPKVKGQRSKVKQRMITTIV